MSTPYRKVLMIGATSGIGWALAEQFVQSGSQVIVAGRRLERLHEFVQKHGSDKAHPAQVDILQFDKMPAFAASVVKEHPDLDCVFLNSGTQCPANFADAASVDLDALRGEIDSNYYSYLVMIKAFVPHLQEVGRANKPAALMFTSSGLALIPIPGVANYCATKAALHHLLISLRHQLQPSGIKVVEVFPPAVQTELHDYQGQEKGRSFGMPIEAFTEDAWNGITKGQDEVPVGRAKDLFEKFEKNRGPLFESFFKPQ